MTTNQTPKSRDSGYNNPLTEVIKSSNRNFINEIRAEKRAENEAKILEKLQSGEARKLIVIHE